MQYYVHEYVKYVYKYVYICTQVNSIFLLLTFQGVQDEYTTGGWSKHHSHMLDYEESHAQNHKPSILFNVTQPAHGKEKNWEVPIISADFVCYT